MTIQIHTSLALIAVAITAKLSLNQVAAASEIGSASTTTSASVVGLNAAKKYNSIQQLKEQARYNELVEIKAVVDRVKRDNNLLLKDSSSTIHIDVAELPLPVKVGETIGVQGRFENEGLNYEINALIVEHQGRLYRIDEIDRTND